MWKQMLELLWQSLRLAEETQQNRQNIKELEKVHRDFARTMEQEVYDLRRAIERLAEVIERNNQREEAERRILKLELENKLLRAARGLPPRSDEESENSDPDNQTEETGKSDKK